MINYKNLAFQDGTAVYDIERGSSKATRKYPWQTDTSIGKKSWGYIEGEENKKPNEIIDILVDIVSKNGNLLLNIGPKPDGTITEQQQEVLIEIGKWLDVNGEAIYGTRPWKISGEGPTENVDESVHFNEYKFQGYVSKDLRFTSKGDSLFVIVLDIPHEPITVNALSISAGNGKIQQVELIGSAEKIVWTQKVNGLQIQPSKKISN